jgi:hypothetical protein
MHNEEAGLCYHSEFGRSAQQGGKRKHQWQFATTTQSTVNICISLTQVEVHCPRTYLLRAVPPRLRHNLTRPSPGYNQPISASPKFIHGTTPLTETAAPMVKHIPWGGSTSPYTTLASSSSCPTHTRSLSFSVFCCLYILTNLNSRIFSGCLVM